MTDLIAEPLDGLLPGRGRVGQQRPAKPGLRPYIELQQEIRDRRGT
ncbi:MAG: hypothetical protein V7694_20835 [Rhodococcus sp. (in: high G+C Gram-positive bacteria)]